MPAQTPNAGFASLCFIKIGNVKLSFVSDWRITPTNAATSPVFGISGSTRAMGQIQHQVSFMVSFTNFVSLPNQNFDPYEIAINDGTQIEIELNNPDNNPTSNGQIQGGGGIILLSELSPNADEMSLGTGSPATQVMSFYANSKETR